MGWCPVNIREAAKSIPQAYRKQSVLESEPYISAIRDYIEGAREGEYAFGWVSTPTADC